MKGNRTASYELQSTVVPTLEEVMRWIGSRVNDIYGAPVGRLEDVLSDPVTEKPRWLLVRTGATGAHRTLVPAVEAVGGRRRLCVKIDRELVRSAPAILRGTPMSEELDAEFARLYGVRARPQAPSRQPNAAAKPPSRPGFVPARARQRPQGRMQRRFAARAATPSPARHSRPAAVSAKLALLAGTAH